MATIVFPYAIVDGNTLNAEQLSRNIHSGTHGESVQGEINGNLDSNNLDPTFRLDRQHIAPGELGRIEGVGDGGLTTIHLDSRAFGSSLSEAKYITIPGLGCRWHLPYGATCLITWDFLLSVWKMWDGIFSAPTVAAQIILQAGLDGTALAGTQTLVPETAWVNTPDPYIESRESVNTSWRSLAHVVTLAPGWHEITMRIWMRADSTADTILWPTTLPAPSDLEPVYHAARVTIGHRHPQVLILT